MAKHGFEGISVIRWVIQDVQAIMVLPINVADKRPAMPRLACWATLVAAPIKIDDCVPCAVPLSLKVDGIPATKDLQMTSGKCSVESTMFTKGHGVFNCLRLIEQSSNPAIHALLVRFRQKKVDPPPPNNLSPCLATLRQLGWGNSLTSVQAAVISWCFAY